MVWPGQAALRPWLPRAAAGLGLFCRGASRPSASHAGRPAVARSSRRLAEFLLFVCMGNREQTPAARRVAGPALGPAARMSGVAAEVRFGSLWRAGCFSGRLGTLPVEKKKTFLANANIASSCRDSPLAGLPNTLNRKIYPTRAVFSYGAMLTRHWLRAEEIRPPLWGSRALSAFVLPAPHLQCRNKIYGASAPPCSASRRGAAGLLANFQIGPDLRRSLPGERFPRGGRVGSAATPRHAAPDRAPPQEPRHPLFCRQ